MIEERYLSVDFLKGYLTKMNRADRILTDAV